MATRHSSVVGGSSAERILNCPASLSTTVALPASADTTSVYAEEGTHYHHVMDELMRARQRDNDADLSALALSYVGRHFYDRDFTREGFDGAVEPALSHLAWLEEEYGGGFRVVGVEKEVYFPGIPGAFGTGDLLLQSVRHIILADWKFGAGVPVYATYTTADNEEFVNAQLLFYLTAAFATLPSLFEDRDIIGAIIQPRTNDPLTHTEIALIELKNFAQDLELAIIEAVGRNPRRERGEHCRFAPCKLICPLWTGPLLDLSMLPGVKPKPADVTKSHATPYGVYLAVAKALLNDLLILQPEIDAQIHAFLEAGGVVPGWKLKDKLKNRQWADETIVVPALKKIGFTESEIWQRKLQTFTSVDATAKRRKVAIPAHLRVAPPSTETTIATTDDPAPAVERAQAVKNFSAALKRLTK